MTHRTAGESRAEYIAKMGKDLGEVYHGLSNELAWVYAKWGEYVELFGTNKRRIDLLNSATPSHQVEGLTECA